jgi:hypothetical protein
MNELRGFCIECGMKPNECMCRMEPEELAAATEKKKYEFLDRYRENFLDPEFADRLFKACQTLPMSRPMTKQSDYKVPLRRLRMPLFARDPGLLVTPTMNQGTMISFADAPAEIRGRADILDKEAGKQVEFLSLNGYENRLDRIDWHQHREDDCRDARVLIVSLGAHIRYPACL